ncbi:LLM class flavin-dependent oxidoreductase [Calidifontibacter sp. DB0510]|uniref:LLM class flavin-dependent oxidoreductase n=1 Tax=Metallococcus carri TaxID=1656884 RepID=A0A967EEH8_9MICO|nr:LLM class flavin-dependent oxidoreductase [Metallococcus carri]NHN55681.1 LLM class flavin-dependent oxidoreductase [Metallococcus carri]NOP38135.1 LLM class flavin-dependent oxidoreductase [Calidifontibacter sp. DB2511S]
MSVRLHWFLPTSGDSRSELSLGDAVSAVSGTPDGPAASGTRREPTPAYLGQIARSAEQQGFEAALTPTSSDCQDAWIATAGLAQVTERLKFLVAFRPGLIAPTLAAQMAATFQRFSGNRLLLNVVTGGEDVEQRRFGDGLTKDQRYARTGEFLHIVRRLFEGERVTYRGEHLWVEDAVLPNPTERPAFFFGGSSPAAIRVAAEHSDVYLTWGEPPAGVAEKLDRVRAAAAQHGRELQYGIRLHVIARPTAEEAWVQADRLLAGLDPGRIADAQERQRKSQSEGQQRMTALHGGDTRQLVVSPNLWAGVGLVRGGAGTALVGSYAEVADRIEEYHAIGLDHFILSGYPHLEETYYVGEGLRPELERRGLLGGPGIAADKVA